VVSPTIQVTATATVTQSTQLTPQQALAAVTRLDGASVLEVQVRLKSHAILVGEGFVYRSDASGTYVVTSKSLVLGVSATAVSLQPVTGHRSYAAQVILAGTGMPNNLAQLAVIRIQPLNLPVLAVGSRVQSHLGDPVVTLGITLAKSGLLSSDLGSVSAVRRDLHDGSGPTWIQHTTTISTTAIGGPLVDLYGTVVGIDLVARTLQGGTTLARSGGVFFALPAAAAHPMIDRLVAGIIAKHVRQTVAAPPTATATALPPTMTPTATPTSTATPTDTATATSTLTAIATSTTSPTTTSTTSPTPGDTATSTATLSPTATATPAQGSTSGPSTPYTGVGFTVQVPQYWSATALDAGVTSIVAPDQTIAVEVQEDDLSQPLSQTDIQAAIGQIAGTAGGAACTQFSVTYQQLTIGTLQGDSGTLTCSDGKVLIVSIAADATQALTALTLYTANTPASEIQQASTIVASLQLTSSSGGTLA